jgi:hypothetical protein
MGTPWLNSSEAIMFLICRSRTASTLARRVGPSTP